MITNDSIFEDIYLEKLRAAMLSICREDYPGRDDSLARFGVPQRYVELTKSLPDRMRVEWQAEVPIDQFQKTVDLWLEAHRTAVAMFRSALTGQ